ncbi:hypothetical protein [Bartonella bacilliformis]|uniref:POTRA domain-containing protein n=1 Tax=Bartonella bacilliformis Ver097 TaxID=1293911 RepID=A0A072R579_BARBA|nr:hypothetical protein [Bartonella bacilliformis]KEG21088.1 hypothetical protein H710_00033 [Bartonella bacilliformis Ver097]
MKPIVVAAVLFSIFSAVLSPVIANALPVGNGWGIKRDQVVKELLHKGGFGEREEQILKKIVVPRKEDLFNNQEKKFEVQSRYQRILFALGLRIFCTPLNPKEYSGQKWVSCEY